MPTAWPTTTDLTTLLGGITGLTYSTSLNTAGRCLSATRWLERFTGYTPFLGASATRTFDPPGPRQTSYGNVKGGERILRLDMGLVSVSSLTIGGTAYTEGTDFWLIGNVAPYKLIEFAFPVLAATRSISITGVWGYCVTNIPDDAWEAVLFRAAGEILQSDKQAKLQKPVEWKLGDAGKRYGFENTNQIGQGWMDLAKELARPFVRVSAGF